MCVLCYLDCSKLREMLIVWQLVTYTHLSEMGLDLFFGNDGKKLFDCSE